MVIEISDQAHFNPSRQLLNPKFESYKLTEYDQSKIQRIKLKDSLNTSIDKRQSLNYQELKFKSFWNHLLIGSFTSKNSIKKQQIIWIDPSTLHIHSLQFLNDQLGQNPQVNLLLTLPNLRPSITSILNDSIEFDFPTAISLNANLLNHSNHLHKRPWLIVDGANSLFLVDLNPKSPQLLAQHQLNHPTLSKGFYSLSSLQVKNLDSNEFWVVLRAKNIQKLPVDTNDEKNITKKNNLVHEIFLLQLKIISNPSSEINHLPFAFDLHLKTKLIGDHDLVLSHFDSLNQRWCFGSTSPFNLSNCLSSTIQTKNQHSSSPKTGKAWLTDSQNSNQNPSHSSSFYSWNQTLSSLTIVFSIPLSISSKSLKIIFKHNLIKLSLQTNQPSIANSILKDYISNLFNYFGQELINSIDPSLVLETWDFIIPEDCTWFIENEPTRSILTVELGKKNSLRWPQVFKIDDQLHETLDPSELQSISDNLQKFTAPQVPPTKRQKQGLGLVEIDQVAKNPSGFLGNHNTTLSGGEIDEEIDMGDQTMKIGVQMTWLLSHTPQTEDLENWKIVKPHQISSVEIISSPPLQETISPSFQWNHVLTYPALAFVMASKRDIRFSFFTDKFAIIFENSTLNHQIGNVFIYYQSNKTKANQKVIKLKNESQANNDQGDELLGTCGIRKPNGEYLLICLCQSEIIICHDL
ncbi:hypothetical protein O181_073158 [Austropuccinia psidii MF-1]|uniref:NudC domain-containing protein 1 n=1 Tax=Austropuccinia psidii MF-1 TaxID=1389203 RepID=A0A9Q3F8L3_9BASI|nr:hypothetical protein [Austropuccinia psidii MF-1]